MKHLQFLIVLLLFLVCYNAGAQDTIILKNSTKQIGSNEREGYFFTKKKLPIQQIITEKFKLKKDVDNKYITGYMWVKFVIKNNTNANRFVLHASDGHIAGLYMYKPTPTGYQMTPPQQHHPEDGREIYNRIPAFFIDIDKGETKVYYLKIETLDEIVNYNFIIQDYIHYAQDSQIDYLIIGLYFGFLLLIIAVNIFYFISLKDPIFLIYVVYVFGSFLCTATLNGFTWLLIPDPDVAYHACFFCLRFWPDCLLFFTIHLVNLKQYRKPLTTISYVFIVYHTIIMAVLDYLNAFNIRENLMAQWETINWGISILLISSVVVLSYKNNKYLFKYYLIAYGILLMIFIFIVSHGFSSNNWLLFEHGLKAGTLIEMLTLSFAVSRRFKMTEMDLKLKKEEKLHLNDKVTQLEMDVRKAQMNPHFMFNALTSIEYFIFKNDSKQARAYLNKFAQLMRLTLDHSRSNFVPLQDEVRALKFYVELEFLRMKAHMHSFEIKIEEGIDCDTVLIPPLIIQPFVENAIWHGLQKISRDGNLRIYIRFINDELYCTIEDDGIGINTIPIQKKNHKSSGVLITQERLNLIHAINNTSCKFTIENIKKKNSPESSGTRVQFTMPYHL
jgi:sensor histidine kinase YesM